jgi:hypothetical protein
MQHGILPALGDTLMVVSEISAGFGALSAAYEIAKGLKNIDDRVKLNAAVIELQEKILSAQEATAQSREKMRSLEQQLEAFQNWETTAERYELKDFGSHTYAYSAKPDRLNGDPAHLACPNCFRERRLSILQYEGTYSGRKRFICQGCDKHVDLGHIHIERGSYQADTDWSPFDV